MKRDILGRKHKGEFLHFQAASFIKTYFPDITYHFDASALRYAPRNLKELLNDNNQWPSVFIAEPRGRYHGLFINLVSDDYRAYRKGGVPSQGNEKALQMQITLDVLETKGFRAITVQGMKGFITEVQNYLK